AFANVARKSRIERTTVDRVGSANREVVFIFAWNAHVADVDRRLNRTGPVYEIDVTFVARRNGWVLVGRRRAALPTAECFFDFGESLVDVNVADDDQVRSIWNVGLRHKRPEIGARQCADGFFIRHDEPVRMVAENSLL